jgi:hypothetical protein
MRGRSLRCRGPRLRLSQRVNRGSNRPIYVHHPIAFDDITGFVVDAVFLVQDARGNLVDPRNEGSFDLPVLPRYDG